jgi:hypothetical protein
MLFIKIMNIIYSSFNNIVRTKDLTKQYYILFILIILYEIYNYF